MTCQITAAGKPMDNDKRTAAPPTPDVYLAHMDVAWRQLCAGIKPSADSVLREVGGSKATAVAAMRHFWKHYAPELLTGRDDQEVPAPIQQLAGQLWQKALVIARDRATEDLKGRQAAVAAEHQALASERQQLALREAEFKGQLAAVRGELATAQAVSSAKAAENRKLTADNAKLLATNTSLDQLVAKHLHQISDLKDDLHVARTEATSRQRDALDAATSTAKLQTQTSELQREVAALKEALEQASQAAAAAMQAEKADAARQREELRESHHAEIDRLVTAHNNSQERQRIDHDAFVTQLKQQHKEHDRVQQQRISRLEERNASLSESVAALSKVSAETPTKP